MTLPPERIGDKGQRYEVRACDYPNPGWCVVGWTNDADRANRMADAIKLAPSCTDTRVVDREAAA